MAETAPKPRNRGAKILKNKLDKARDKNADVRARKNAKPGSGTITEKVKRTAKKAPEKRGLPARVEQSRGNVNKANPPKEIRLKGEGGTGRNVKAPFKPVPLGDKPKLLSNARSVAGTGARVGLTRAAQYATGPVGFLVGMTGPAGEGSDRPRGPLMRGGKQPGYKYRDEGRTVDRSSKGDREVSADRSTKIDRVVAPKPKPRPDGGMTEAKRRSAMEFRKKAQGQKKEPRKVESPKAERPKFRGNWTGAAPTAMQARGVARTKRKSFADLFKNK